MEEQNKAEKKIKILALCDSPTSATGFAQVSRNILRGLAETGKYEIDVIGINYFGDFYDRVAHPYNIYPAMPQGYQDMYGRGRLLNAINGHEAKFGLKQPWDIVFTIQDPFVIEGLGLDYPFAEQLKVSEEMWKRSLPMQFWYKWIAYFPVDSDVKENWVTDAIALADHPVAYCDWGKKKILEYDREKFKLNFNLAVDTEGGKRKAGLNLPSLKDRIKVIHHGVDTDMFKPLPDDEKKKFRKEFFKGVLKDSTYLIVNVSRNQPRKDLSRTMSAFARFKKIVPDSFLYLHCNPQDAGGSVYEMARNFDLVLGKDYTVPNNFNSGVGFPVETVNKIYNAADLCITTTLGEGWGFITTEAMATKTPIAAPYITSIIDIFGGDPKDLDIFDSAQGPQWANIMRGIPVKAGSTSSEWICMGVEDNERIRPLTNVDDLVEKMLWAYKNPLKVSEMVERAYEWVKELAWPNIVSDWDKIFTEAYDELKKERALGERIDKAGRNDPCPCGSGRKAKHCHLSPDKLDKFRDWLEGGEEDGNKNDSNKGDIPNGTSEDSSDTKAGI